MDSSDTKDLDITTRDWKYQYHQHGSAAESPQGSNDPTRGIREDIRRLNISSDNGAPKPSINKDKSVNPYSDIDLERDIFEGCTYEEFDMEYRCQNKSLSNSTEKNDNSCDSDYKAFNPLPGSKTNRRVYLKEIKSDDKFNRWVHCLIGQMKLAGLGNFIPNKNNEWSSDITTNVGLSNRIAYIWERCVPEKCCPDWVTLTPYITGITSECLVYNLLKCYDQMNKDLDIWKEAIKYSETDRTTLDPLSFWIGCTQMYQKFYLSGKCHDTDSILECLTQTTVEAIADRSELVKQTLITDKKLDIPSALKLMEAEVTQPVKPKQKNLGEEDKGRKPYERSKKNPTNIRNNWNRDSNGTNKTKKSGKNYNKSEVINKKGKTNYIKKSTLSDNDDSAEEDAFLLRQHKS